jgi:hypothetical protein
MELELSSAERELLLEILEEHHRELLREIAKTSHYEFKRILKAKEKLLEEIVDKLESQQPREGVLRSA